MGGERSGAPSRLVCESTQQTSTAGSSSGSDVAMSTDVRRARKVGFVALNDAAPTEEKTPDTKVAAKGGGTPPRGLGRFCRAFLPCPPGLDSIDKILIDSYRAPTSGLTRAKKAAYQARKGIDKKLLARMYPRPIPSGEESVRHWQDSAGPACHRCLHEESTGRGKLESQHNTKSSHSRVNEPVVKAHAPDENTGWSHEPRLA